MSPARALGLLAVAASAVLLAPSGGQAQDWYNVDDPTDLNPIYTVDLQTGSVSVSPTALFRCIDWAGLWRLTDVNYPWRSDCLVDLTEEDRVRRETRALDRWIKAGVLGWTQVWYGVEQLKNVVQESQDLYRQARSIFAGFEALAPERTVHRVIAASDRFVRRIDQQQSLDAQYEVPMFMQRHEWVGLIASDALAAARESQEAAASMSDATVEMAARLSSDGRVDVIALDSDRAFAGQRLPPIALGEDGQALPPWVYTHYSDMSSAARPAAVSSGAPSFAMATMAIGPSASAGSNPLGIGADDLACALDPDGTDDPAVIFQRVAVQSTGSQTASVAVIGSTREQREMLRTVRMRELESFWESFIRALLTAFRSM